MRRHKAGVAARSARRAAMDENASGRRARRDTADVRTGRADLPLHGGRAPAWLFERMASLGREISIAIVDHEGTSGLLRRWADPVWFQALGCVLGFDWHSSGVTTTVCGALKEGLRRDAEELGIVIAGGKGRASRRTPREIEDACSKFGLDAEPLVRASRLSAKVDSAAIQDGYQIYHHSFVLARDGCWGVIQQGMNDQARMARRYHWLVPARFDADPHAGVAGARHAGVLNLVAAEGEGNRDVAARLAREHPAPVLTEITRMKELEMPRHHAVRLSDLDPRSLQRILLKAYEAQPHDYTQLLATPGVGAKGLRALSLVAELTYGEPAAVRDPVSFSFAHGGKDGTPYPVDRLTYDSTISSLRRAIEEAKTGRSDKRDALRRLGSLAPEHR